MPHGRSAAGLGRSFAPLVVVLSLFEANVVSAHAMQKSFVDLSANDAGATVLLDFDIADLEDGLQAQMETNWQGGPNEVVRIDKVLTAIATAGLTLKRGGSMCSPEVTAPPTVTKGLVRNRLSYACPTHGALEVEYPLIKRARPGHVCFLVVRIGPRVVTTTLTEANATWLESSAATVWTGAWRFLKLGVGHILLGYDHLLFLLALLLVASRVRELVKIVTSFTVAHSITLIGAGLGAVSLPSRIVEPAIAATIIYVGLENYWIKTSNRRWVLTFALGLVHGFGFAGLFKEVGLPDNGRVLALVSFNVGVEIGQVAVVAAIAPLVGVLAHRWRHSDLVVRRGISGVVVALGAIFLVRRLFL